MKAGILLAMALVVGSACRAPDKPPPSILLVSIDSLRADHLGAYGYGRPTSPFLDSLAASGVRFSAFESLSPWTLPSHATMLSGLHELEHGVVEMDRGIGADHRLVAEAFRARGYRTAAAVTGFFVSRKFGFERGFDLFRDFDVKQGEDMHGVKPLGAKAIDTILEWIGAEREKPFFVFLHLFDVHWPYDPPAPHRELFSPPPDADPGPYRGYEHYFDHRLEPRQIENIVARYDGAIHYVDTELARLDRELRSRGLDFVTIVTADHGEEFFEHGSWGHAHTLYREQLAIPLIVQGPGIPKGRVVAAPADMTDVAPTLFDLGAMPPDPAHHGRSLRALWEGADPPAERPRISTTSRFRSLALGWRSGGEALVVDLARGRRELFDETKDPLDAADLAAKSPTRAAALEALLREGVTRGLSTTVRIEWNDLPDATVRISTDGVLVAVSGMPPLAGLPREASLPMRGDGQLALKVFPSDAKLRANVLDDAARVVAADGSPMVASREVGLVDPALASAPAGPVPAGSVRISSDVALAPTGAVELSDSEREALRSLGYVSEQP